MNATKRVVPNQLWYDSLRSSPIKVEQRQSFTSMRGTDLFARVTDCCVALDDKSRLYDVKEPEVKVQSRNGKLNRASLLRSSFNNYLRQKQHEAKQVKLVEASSLLRLARPESF